MTIRMTRLASETRNNYKRYMNEIKMNNFFSLYEKQLFPTKIK